MLFPIVTDFHVLQFDAMLSDAHCGLHISFSCQSCDNLANTENNETNESVCTVSKAVWDSST